ncbi:MAG: hydantoinase/oxoprolinase N-terminal domain-containing protein, partial [Alphaproteobacteria bacterium]
MTQAKRGEGRSVWIGIDTGGTFTDLVLVDMADGAYAYYKLPSTNDDPSRAILDGIEAVLAEAGLGVERVGFVGHGTTVATNAVLEGKVSPTGMLTTEGFRDVIEIARQRRPHFFNLDVPKPTPPARRDARLEIAERTAEDGAEVVPLDEAGVKAAVETLKAKKVQAVAICFLHSYANPAHEARAKELVKQHWPEAYVCTSHEVLAEFREYERFATTSMNASLLPVMDRYLQGFEEGCRNLGIENPPRVMQSNGGAVSTDAVRRLPVNTLFSGPAGGVIATAGLGKRVGIHNLIAFDMGGTSTDVCLIREGEPAKKNQREMAGMPVRARTLDIHTIGAGGG